MFCRDCGKGRIGMSGQYRRFCLLICLLGSVAAGSASGKKESIAFKSFPAPVRIDHGSYVQTSLYLKCRSKEYNLSFPEFISKYSDSREAVFQQLALAIREKNLQACMQLSFRKSSMTAEEAATHERNVTQMMGVHARLLNSAFLREDFKNLYVSNQFILGNGGLFVWGVDSATSVSPTSFRTLLWFETDSNNRFSWNPMHGQPDPLIALFRDIMDQNAKSPEKYRPIENGTFDYEIPIYGSGGANPVYVQFNGSRYDDIDIFKDTVDPSDKVLGIYQKAYHTLRDGSPESFAQFYTERSRQKYMTWLDKTDPNYLGWYRKDITNGGRKIAFVLDADPFYFVFYKKDNGAVKFEDIVRDPKDGSLKLTNFYCYDYLHKFFTDKKLFLDPVLKSIIK
ncbi:MAG TPA: hypothetical protein VJJ98_07830 [Sedimentisphaerales bacterium]|nr:hypothetical protein [Sedimentisphaerales bacterium]